MSNMNVDQRKTDQGRSELARGGNSKVRGQNDSGGDECQSASYSSQIERGVVGLSLKEGVAGGNSVADGLMTRLGPMEDGVKVCEDKSVTLRTWKRVA